MAQINVVFYETDDGRQPVREFLLSLDTKMRAKMVMIIDLLCQNGPELREPYSRPLGDGIFELRAQTAGNITRTLYFFYAGSQAILTNGFVKKTQKTPPQEIERAQRYRTDYLRQRGEQS